MCGFCLVGLNHLQSAQIDWISLAIWILSGCVGSLTCFLSLMHFFCNSSLAIYSDLCILVTSAIVGSLHGVLFGFLYINIGN